MSESTRRRPWSPITMAIGASFFGISVMSPVLRADLIHRHWAPTTLYPVEALYGGSCVTGAGHIYCVGGTESDRVLYAPLSTAGIGRWRQTTPYGEGSGNRFLSCVTELGNIYCVGGLNRSGYSNDATGAVWFAPLSKDGIGPWQRTLNYGVPAVTSTSRDASGLNIWAHSCVTSGGFIYCIGGLERTHRRVASGSVGTLETADTPTTRVLYAPLSHIGVGDWRVTSTYSEPVSGHSCVAAEGQIYCVGGMTNERTQTADVWYARIQSDGGLGAWTMTTSYGGGAVDGLSCTAVDYQIVCVGGSTNEVWSAPFSRNGLGAWSQQPDYPGANWKPSCVSATSDVFCVGGSLGAGRIGTTSAFYTASASMETADACAEVGGRRDPGSDRCTTIDILDQVYDFVDPEPLPADGIGLVSEDIPVVTGLEVNEREPEPGAASSTAPSRSVASRAFDGSINYGAALLDAALRGGPTNADCVRDSAPTARAEGACHATTTTVTLEPSSAPYGGLVIVTATVTDASAAPIRLTGSPSFNDDGAGGKFGSGTCQPERTALICTTSYTAPDSGRELTITAAYKDRSHQLGSANAQLQLTGAAPTLTVTSSASPSVVGQPVSFAATISPFDGGGGTVRFVIDGTLLTSPQPGVASDSMATSGSTSTLSVGLHTVTAFFSGGISLDDKVRLMAPSQGSATQQVIGELKDQPSCRALGGSWTSSSETCTVSDLSVDAGNSFQIEQGVTLAVTDGTIVVVSGGMIANHGAIISSGYRDDREPSTIAIEPGGVVRNFGTILNLSRIIVEDGAALTNVGVMNNECGATTGGAGSVSGAAPVDLCETTVTSDSLEPSTR